MEKFQQLLEGRMSSFAAKTEQNQFIRALNRGMMGVLPILMVGAVFSILTNFPIDAYKNFIAERGIDKIFALGSGVTTDIISVYMAFMLAKSFAEANGSENGSHVVGLFGLLAFFMLMPVSQTAEEAAAFEVSYLGAQGMIVAILASWLTAKVYQFFIARNITIKLPDNVPDMVIKSFTNIIPGLGVAVVFMALALVFRVTPYGNAFTCIYTVLQQPLGFLSGNVLSLIIGVLLSSVLWFFGIHGSNIMGSIFIPVFIGAFVENMEAVSAGGAVVNPINISLYDLTTIGGCGVTLGLAILMAFFSRSEKNKALGKFFLPVSIFNVNEPMVFGIPLMLNPTYIIPFVVAPMLAVVIAWLAICVLHIVPAAIGIPGLAFVPAIFRGFVNFGWQGCVLEAVIIAMSVVVYYPFFRMDDNRALAEEQATASADESPEA